MSAIAIRFNTSTPPVTGIRAKGRLIIRRQVGMRWKEKASTCVPTTKAECEQVGMMWKEKANKCFPLHKSHTLSYYVLGVIGLGCSLAGFIIVCGEWRRSAMGQGDWGNLGC